MTWATIEERRSRGIISIEYADTDNGADLLMDCRRRLRAHGIRIAICHHRVYTNMDPEIVCAKLSAMFEVPVIFDTERMHITIQIWNEYEED